jgi:hypothetical protein
MQNEVVHKLLKTVRLGQNCCKSSTRTCKWSLRFLYNTRLHIDEPIQMTGTEHRNTGTVTTNQAPSHCQGHSAATFKEPISALGGPSRLPNFETR